MCIITTLSHQHHKFRPTQLILWKINGTYCIVGNIGESFIWEMHYFALFQWLILYRALIWGWQSMRMRKEYESTLWWLQLSTLYAWWTLCLSGFALPQRHPFFLLTGMGFSLAKMTKGTKSELYRALHSPSMDLADDKNGCISFPAPQ